MKKIILLLLAIFLIFSQKNKEENTLADVSEAGFRRLMQEDWAREVFDLQEEEAVAVFGEESERYFL